MMRDECLSGRLALRTGNGNRSLMFGKWRLLMRRTKGFPCGFIDRALGWIMPNAFGLFTEHLAFLMAGD